MATTSNLSSIIRYYADKQKSPFIDFNEFCMYVKKYAEHHVEEEASLVKYLGELTSTMNTVSAELQGLSDKHLVTVLKAGNKKTILSITYLANKFTEQYREMQLNEGVPFPLVQDLPKRFPTSLLEHKAAADYIDYITTHPSPKTPFLYVLDFPREVPSILLPSTVPLDILIANAQKKIRKILIKDEHHDYFLKKLRTTNPTKEISIKSFYQHFVDEGDISKIDITTGDDYYFWNQTLYYVRQDYEKIQDKTLEDINVLQAIQILELWSVQIKEKMQIQQKHDEAIRELQQALAKPPYHFSMNQILKFQDQNGNLLYGKYTEEELKEFFQKMTTEAPENALPEILVFKVESGTRYYIYRKKVIQLIVRLCNEAHGSIEKALIQKWYEKLLNYEKLPEMTNYEAFENVLKEMVHQNSPVLWSLLNAQFITLLSSNKENDETMQSYLIFSGDALQPYSTLLLLRNDNIYSAAKMKLPVLYTIPVLSWLFSLFHSKQKTQKKSIKEHKKTANVELEQELHSEDEKPNPSSGKKAKTKSEQVALRAKEIATDFIPEGSTLDRELDYLNSQWNKMITPQASAQLTEDVNSLIRDYTRRVIKTLSAVSFTKERVEGLAKTLVNTPNMQKISEQNALTEYVTLYILRLVSNI